MAVGRCGRSFSLGEAPCGDVTEGQGDVGERSAEVVIVLLERSDRPCDVIVDLVDLGVHPGEVPAQDVVRQQQPAVGRRRVVTELFIGAQCTALTFGGERELVLDASTAVDPTRRVCEQPAPRLGLGDGDRRCASAAGEMGVDPVPGLLTSIVGPPRKQQGRDEPQPLPRRVDGIRPRQRGPQVVVFGVEPLQPLELLLADPDPELGSFGQVDAPATVGGDGVIEVAGFGEAVEAGPR